MCRRIGTVEVMRRYQFPDAGQLITGSSSTATGFGMAYDRVQPDCCRGGTTPIQVTVIDTIRMSSLRRSMPVHQAGVLAGTGNGNATVGSPVPYTGAATFAVTLSRDRRTLYAVNSGANSIAVIP